MSRLSKCHMIRQQLPELTLVQDESLAVPSILREIHMLPNEALFGGTIERSEMAKAARAGLVMGAGDWDEAHRLVQELDTPEAQYWHAIAHRREPDTSNAKYWFRRVGNHPVMDKLVPVLTGPDGSHNTVVELLTKNGIWDPITFVDVCMACHEGSRRELLPILLDIQQKEFTLLLDYCVQQALDRSPEDA